MRVIAGSLKGRRLKAPAWDGLRPTSDKLRETLFNILAPRIAGARVLDGYAGTGAIGIEALSRGAAHVTFVEQDRRAAALIEENLEHSGVRTGYTMERDSVLRAFARLPVGHAFDIILLDPPYGDSDLQAVVAAGGERLAPGGVLVLEHGRRHEAPGTAGQVVRSRELRSGDSRLAFYERKP
jgi:16S rRNA (guanine(966)-N(2))-methyltransferase RsmD